MDEKKDAIGDENADALHIVLIDDDRQQASLVGRHLSKPFPDATFIAIHSGEEGLDYVSANSESGIHLVILDYRLPDTDGLAVLQRLRKIDEHLPVVFVTSAESVSVAVESMKLGAYDFVVKDDNYFVTLPVAIEGTIKRFKKDKENLELKRRLQQLVITDGLTGVYNHRYFQQQLALELIKASRYQYPVSLIMLDVDHFKIYNDTNGHPMGDEVLRQLSALLCQNVRKSDVVVRYGGEEFAIILPHASRVQAAFLAEKLREVVEVHSFAKESCLPGGTLTVSLGIATAPGDGKERQELIEKADQALYYAKRAGRNRIYPEAG